MNKPLNLKFQIVSPLEFHRAIRRNGPWILASLDPKVEGSTPKVANFKGDADRSNIKSWHEDRDGKLNLYFQPNPTRKPIPKKCFERDIARVDYAFTEADPLDGEAAADARKRHRANIKAKAELGIIPPPTMIYDSGNGVVALWKLVEPITIDGPDDIASCKAINKGIADALGGKAAGYDNCQNLDRLLRVPFTKNLPDALKRAKGRKIEQAGNVEYWPERVCADFEFPAASVVNTGADFDIGDAEEVALDDLAPHVAEFVNQNVPVGERSEHAFKTIKEMMQDRMTPEKMLGVLLNPEFAISERILAKPDPEEFARKEIKRAAAKIELPPTAEEEFIEPVDEKYLKQDQHEPKEDAKADFYEAFKPSALLALPSPKWLVRGVLIERGLFEIYGKFKTGKTFWAIEMACCIATGLDFMDAPTKRGSVLYVIAEGSRKLFAYRVRQWAFERSNGDAAERDRLMAMLDDNLAIVPVAVFVDVKEKVEKFTKANPQPRAVVFIDTLFRSIKGDVMNSDDMTNFVAGCSFIQRRLDSALVFLHHQKRTEAKGGFGSVVGEASVDGALKVSSPRKGQTELRLEIMRDGDANVKPWLCDLKVCEIEGMDLSDDDVKTTGALVFVGRGRGEMIDTLQAIYDNRDEPLSVEFIALAIGKVERTAERHIATLRKKEWLSAKGYEVTPKGLRQVTLEDMESDDEDDSF